MFVVISFNFSYFFHLFYFTQYWNSTTSSLLFNYLYFLSLFVLKNKKCNFLLCSSNCTHFFFLTFTLSPSLYLFHLSKHSTLISLFLFPFIFLYFVSFYYHFLSINLSFTLPFFIIFSHKKVVISYSFSLNFLVDFYFYFSCISILAW